MGARMKRMSRMSRRRPPQRFTVHSLFYQWC